jgi:hypothetical protein
LVTLFWCVYVGVRIFDAPISTSFMSIMGASALLALLFSIWWLTNGTVRLADRLVGFSVLVAGIVVAGFLCHPSVGPIGLVFLGLPLALTVWMTWLFVSRRWSTKVQRAGTAIVRRASLASGDRRDQLQFGPVGDIRRGTAITILQRQRVGGPRARFRKTDLAICSPAKWYLARRATATA